MRESSIDIASSESCRLRLLVPDEALLLLPLAQPVVCLLCWKALGILIVLVTDGGRFNGLTWLTCLVAAAVVVLVVLSGPLACVLFVVVFTLPALGPVVQKWILDVVKTSKYFFVCRGAVESGLGPDLRFRASAKNVIPVSTRRPKHPSKNEI